MCVTSAMRLIILQQAMNKSPDAELRILRRTLVSRDVHFDLNAAYFDLMDELNAVGESCRIAQNGLENSQSVVSPCQIHSEQN